MIVHDLQELVGHRVPWLLTHSLEDKGDEDGLERGECASAPPVPTPPPPAPLLCAPNRLCPQQAMPVGGGHWAPLLGEQLSPGSVPALLLPPEDPETWPQPPRPASLGSPHALHTQTTLMLPPLPCVPEALLGIRLTCSRGQYHRHGLPVTKIMKT